MQYVSRLAAAFIAAGCATLAQAQMVGGVSVSPANAKVGEPVTVTANVDVVGSNNYCGFIVFYGDGKSVDGYSDVKKPTPFVTTHVYDKPGSYTLSMGGRSVESHPNCGGADKSTTLTVTGVASAKPAPAAAMASDKPSATAVCKAPWKLVAKSQNAKTGAYACAAKAGTALPEPKPVCPGDLTYSENAKKGQYACKP